MIKDVDKIRITNFSVQLLGIIGVIYFWDPIWFILSLFSIICFLMIGQEMYCHRYLSHKAFEISRAWQCVCAWFSIYNLYGNPIGIAATHVNHHKYSDKEGDPHPSTSPILSWFWLHPNFSISHNASITRKLLQDKFLVFISKNYFKIYYSTIILLSLISLKFVVYGFFVPVIYAFFAVGMVNVICHKFGYRRYETNDNSRNNLFSNALLLFNGISLHNTHHARPNAYNLQEKWYELDIIGFIIEKIRIKK